jgi:hypothetical protein
MVNGYHGGEGTEHEYHQPRCHSFVREGKIEYLGDCEHYLQGQTVELPEWNGWTDRRSKESAL